MFKTFGKSNVFIAQNIRSRYSSQKTHYDILNLKPDCNAKEIRNSFLKLSKKYHPDMQGPASDPIHTANFLKIKEAYNILYNKDSRESYDLSLQNHYRPNETTQRTESWDAFYSASANPDPGPYYGIKGLGKVSNIRIVVILFVIATVFTAFEFALVSFYRHSFTFRRDRLDEVSKEAGVELAKVRANAEKYGNTKQLERFTDKILRESD